LKIIDQKGTEMSKCDSGMKKGGNVANKPTLRVHMQVKSPKPKRKVQAVLPRSAAPPLSPLADMPQTGPLPGMALSVGGKVSKPKNCCY
jgi:hypothetical protein